MPLPALTMNSALVRRHLARQLTTAFAADLLKEDDAALVEYLAAEGLSAAEIAEGRAELRRLAQLLRDRLPVDLRGG